MKKVGVITIHKIHNYGSVLQAYALQKACEDMGYNVEIIDYLFPNSYQYNNKYVDTVDSQPNEPRWIKAIFARGLMKQHNGIDEFVKKRINLSSQCYYSPKQLSDNPPIYDIYVTGSDQVWSPRHCNGDPAFLLHFAPDGSKRISYAASFGSNMIPYELQSLFRDLLSRYQYLAVRENSGCELIKKLTGQNAEVVLDPTLLLNLTEWNTIANPDRLVKKKYILCYFLNYSFNAFPYVDNLAKMIQKRTGYEIVRVARPPHSLFLKHTNYHIGASPEDFLALVRDCEMVLTTSFHGTAFAVNYGKPVFTIVKDRNSGDSRQVSLMQSLGLDRQIITIQDPLPKSSQAQYDVGSEQKKLAELRDHSLGYLKKALNND